MPISCGRSSPWFVGRSSALTGQARLDREHATIERGAEGVEGRSRIRLHRAGCRRSRRLRARARFRAHRSIASRRRYGDIPDAPGRAWTTACQTRSHRRGSSRPAEPDAPTDRGSCQAACGIAIRQGSARRRHRVARPGRIPVGSDDPRDRMERGFPRAERPGAENVVRMRRQAALQPDALL